MVKYKPCHNYDELLFKFILFQRSSEVRFCAKELKDVYIPLLQRSSFKYQNTDKEQVRRILNYKLKTRQMSVFFAFSQFEIWGKNREYEKTRQITLWKICLQFWTEYFLALKNRQMTQGLWFLFTFLLLPFAKFLKKYFQLWKSRQIEFNFVYFLFYSGHKSPCVKFLTDRCWRFVVKKIVTSVIHHLNHMTSRVNSVSWSNLHQ